jgi:hypothetical protein
MTTAAWSGLLSIEDLITRGLEAGAIGVESVTMTLRSIYERRLVEDPIASVGV